MRVLENYGWDHKASQKDFGRKSYFRSSKTDNSSKKCSFISHAICRNVRSVEGGRRSEAEFVVGVHKGVRLVVDLSASAKETKAVRDGNDAISAITMPQRTRINMTHTHKAARGGNDAISAIIMSQHARINMVRIPRRQAVVFVW
ncbi:hypothetical protein K432DRAFT_31388 [Lepidopterella palustris CBS 459.81]|uniref:Uncharacterized protein n=1 Tax=Lepidopterella palustris CBS 459.81 TaxID=1314670 RepID=A0A8E2J808_9PEZI|nr:hypothetical protein K432DRAFT_31388 [Lepidopterella palustris CBS 459.81]